MSPRRALALAAFEQGMRAAEKMHSTSEDRREEYLEVAKTWFEIAGEVSTSIEAGEGSSLGKSLAGAA